MLGFPFLFRGALDVRARQIDEGMMLAATRALAELARDEVPESVVKAYSDDGFEFGPEYLIPKPFDARVLLHVAPAVAKAAMESGVARVSLDLEEYRDRLEASLGPGREAMQRIMGRARKEPARIVLADGYNERVLRAAAQVLEEGTARIVLIGRSLPASYWPTATMSGFSGRPRRCWRKGPPASSSSGRARRSNVSPPNWASTWTARNASILPPSRRRATPTRTLFTSAGSARA